MVRRFFRDGAVYALPAAVTTGTAFLTFPLFAHHFRPRQYGILDLVGFASTLAVMIVAVEIYQGVGRYVSGERDLAVVRRYASTALWWTVACYICFAIVTLTFASLLANVLLGSSHLSGLIRIAALGTAVQGVLSVMQAQLRWQLRPIAFAVASIVNAAFTAGGALALVFLAHLGVAGVFWGQLLGSSVALMVVVLQTRDIFGIAGDRTALLEMLRYSSPLVISNVGVFLNLYADRFVIQHLRSLSDVGVYGVGNRVAMLVMLILVGFQGAAAPLFLSRRDDPATPGEIARIFRLFVALALALMLGLSILAAPMLRILAAPPYQSAAKVVPFLVVSTLFANMYIFAPGLAIAKQTGRMAKLTVIAGIANLLLALALVPVFGIVGAGLGTAVTSVAWFAALMRASNRFYPIPHRWLRLLQAFVVAICIAGAAFAVLSQSRVGALSIGTLAARAGLLAGGIAVCSALCLGTDELARVKRRLDGLLRPNDGTQQTA